jgi:hypothetical protein
MRALDASLKDRVDRMEAAVMRRIDATESSPAPAPKPGRKKSADQ